jgi:hypothetical protein
MRYYFNKGTDLDACLGLLGEKQAQKTLEIKWHDYTFVTGDLTGKTVRQADSCDWVAESLADSGAERYDGGARAKKDPKYSLLHVDPKNPMKGENRSYYFNSGVELNACLALLGQKQGKRKTVELSWHKYTFVTGDLTGKSVRQADTCSWVGRK